LVATAVGVETELVVVETTGDRQPDRPMSEIAGRGAFVKEVQEAVMDGRADVAVHSAKDLPSTELPEMVLAAVPKRGDPRDALFGGRLEDLRAGAPVATGSARRRAQLAALRPDLTFVELRGNIATRLERAPDGGAGVVALVALERLGRLDAVAEVLDTDTMLPQVGQGAIGVECRADDGATVDLVRAVDDAASHEAVRAERSFLAELGGACDLPVGAWARHEDRRLVIHTMVATLDGRVVVRDRTESAGETGCHGADAFGRRAAQSLVWSRGGAALLSGLGVPLPSHGEKAP
jgi:hydroxymethylbilane synthase